VVRFFALLFLLCSCNSETTSVVSENKIVGKVVKIYDGDTYEILLPNHTTQKIRMEGIDAPEKGMPFYKVAKNYLGALCFQKEVTIVTSGRDRYNRTIARSYLPDGRELGSEMVAAGYAWHFVKYSSDAKLDSLEQLAHDEKRGLWIDDNPMTPWDNRKLHRQGISTKDSFAF